MESKYYEWNNKNTALSINLRPVERVSIHAYFWSLHFFVDVVGYVLFRFILLGSGSVVGFCQLFMYTKVNVR